MKLLADYRTRLDQILRDQAAELVQGDKDAAVENAVNEHSRYRPQVKVFDFAGTGTAFDFVLSTIADWEKDFSKISSVEFPADEREPVYLEDEDWRLYEKPTGQVLRLINDTPSAVEKVRVSYTARHKVDAVTGTIPDADFEAVNHYAAAFALGALANQYIQLSAPTISADSVDHRSKADQARSNAAKEEQEYFKHLGIKPGEVRAGFATKDWDVNFPWGEDRLTHPRRWR